MFIAKLRSSDKHWTIMFIAKKIFRANIEENVFFCDIRISGNWDSVFYMLVASDAAALLLLTRIFIRLDWICFDILIGFCTFTFTFYTYTFTFVLWDLHSIVISLLQCTLHHCYHQGGAPGDRKVTTSRSRK